VHTLNAARTFWNDTRGQDLIEYVLVMAVVTAACAVLFVVSGGSFWDTPRPNSGQTASS
jgi:hypothetical protein